jgi:ERCC4-type nuclease
MKVEDAAITVIVDTREQLPLEIKAFPTRRDTLEVGDYGIEGFSGFGPNERPGFIVERKSLQDLIGSLTSGHDRFMAEIKKLSKFEYAAIIIEASVNEVENHDYRSVVEPNTVMQMLEAIEVRRGIHVCWCVNRQGAARKVERLVRQFCKGILNDADKLRPKRKHEEAAR